MNYEYFVRLEERCGKHCVLVRRRASTNEPWSDEVEVYSSYDPASARAQAVVVATTNSKFQDRSFQNAKKRQYQRAYSKEQREKKKIARAIEKREAAEREAEAQRIKRERKRAMDKALRKWDEMGRVRPTFLAHVLNEDLPNAVNGDYVYKPTVWKGRTYGPFQY